MENLTKVLAAYDARILAQVGNASTKAHGLCALSPVGEKNVFLPVDGNGEFVGFNDSYAMTWYHRLDSIRGMPAQDTGYGDDVFAAELLSFRTAVFWAKEKLPLDNYQMFRAVSNSVSGNIPEPEKYGLRSGFVGIKAAITEAVTAALAEFKGLPVEFTKDYGFMVLSWDAAITYVPQCQPTNCFSVV